MKSLRQTRVDYYYNRLNNTIRMGVKSGVIRKMDTAFYDQFYGLLFNMIPVEFYLKKMSMGRCYDASVVLAVAFGEESGAYIARGNLKKTGIAFDGTGKFGHGWVEKDGLVYDTTWQIIMPKEEYYDLMGVRKETVLLNTAFYEKCKGVCEFEVHTKDFYENNYVPFAYPMLIQTSALSELFIQNPMYDGQKEMGERIKEQLPDMEKVYALYEKNARCEVVNAGNTQEEQCEI